MRYLSAMIASSAVPLLMSCSALAPRTDAANLTGTSCETDAYAETKDGHHYHCEQGRWAALTMTPQARPQGTKPCVFKCSVENGAWVCRGNGPQCDGKSPWD